MTARAGRGAALALAVIVLAATAPAAQGHALLDRSDPAPGAVLPADRPPRRASLWFTEPVAAAGDAIAILDGSGKRAGRSEARVASEDPRRVNVDAGELTPGAYVIRWRVTSADNHVMRGTYWFVVGFAPTPPPTAALLGTGAPTLPALEAIARWLGLVATLGLAGAPFFQLLVLRSAALPRARIAPLLMTAGFLVAQLMSAAAQAAAVAEAPVPQAFDAATIRAVLFGSRFAALWWTRLGLGLLLCGLLVGRPRRDEHARRGAIAACACLGALLLACTALAGHAAGGRGALPVPVRVAVDTLHLFAAALWLGALAQVLLWLGRVPSAADGDTALPLATLVPRVSSVALASVAVLLVTGALNTYAQAASLALLLRTAWGQSLLLKLALLLPLLGIAAINLLVLRPRIAAGRALTDAWLPRLLCRLVSAEVLLGAGLLLAVSLLGSLPPPGGKTPPSAAETARQAGALRVALTVDPNWVGVSRFRVALADARGLPPADIRRVILTFTMEGMNMGRTHVTLTPQDGGTYETTGFYVGMPGISQVGVGISRSGGADESAVFRIEVPDVNAGQFAGLRAALGFRPVEGGANPVAADPASVARGRILYERQCAVCHGDSGIGNGPAAPSLLPPPADLTLHARWHADAQLFWFITHGVSGTSMLGFRDRLGITDRWDVINHLHALASAPDAMAVRPTPVAASRPAPAPAAATSLPGVITAAPPPAPFPHPTLTGRLVFGPDFDNDLWLLRLPDGKPAPLTRLGPLEFSSNPAWSPDGKRIAFSYYRLPGGDAIPVPDGTDLYMMNADGSGVRPLVAHDVPGAALQYPAWSADGTAVYAGYVRQGGAIAGIDRVDMSSGARTRVVSSAGFPSLSRDGQRLTYIRFPIPPERGPSLWWSASDGSRARQIVPANVFARFLGPRFAPDGKRLLFAAVGQPAGSSAALGFFRRLLAPAAAHANGDLWDLWVVDLDGSHLRALTTLSEDLPTGAWSPDGRSIAFLGGGSARTAEAGLTLIGADGSILRRLTTEPGHRGLDWTAR